MEVVDRELRLGAAVAVILLTPERHLLLQRRDDKPEIWYPGYWGCFGGGIDPDETPAEALVREVREELSIGLESFSYFMTISFAVEGVTSKALPRFYFVSHLSERQLAELVLGEGQEYRGFPGDRSLRDLRIAPYDAFAIDLFLEDRRLVEA